MSSEEDSQLKDLVSQTLESKGILSKIRAELRANVFLAFEGNEKFREQLRKNDVILDLLKTDNGALALCIVHEFLDFCDLHYTKKVLESEVGSPIKSKNHQQLISDLKLKQAKSKVPVLCQLLETIQSSNPELSNNMIPTPLQKNQSEMKLFNGDHGTLGQKENHYSEEQLILDLSLHNPHKSQEENHSKSNSEPFPNLILKTIDELPSLPKLYINTVPALQPTSPSQKRKIDNGGDTGSVSEIEEDLDSASDLLNSSGSARGDVTQDNSISTLSSGLGDYCEDVNKD